MPPNFQRAAEIDAQGLAVADVQIAVGLGRKTGVDGLTLKLSSWGNIFLNVVQNEI